jgi:hypothetical protein
MLWQNIKMKYAMFQKRLIKESQSIELLSKALSNWLKSQATEEEVKEDGTIKQKMCKASLDMLNKLKSGSKIPVQKKEEGSLRRNSIKIIST